MFHSKFGTTPYACDYTDKLMEIEGQTVSVCDLNSDKLPYVENYFDLITFTEVIEHIENHRNTLSDIFYIKTKRYFYSKHSQHSEFKI